MISSTTVAAGDKRIERFGNLVQLLLLHSLPCFFLFNSVLNGAVLEKERLVWLYFIPLIKLLI